MDKILIKRGTKDKLEKSQPLSQGELFLAKDEERLYVGGPKGNISIPTHKDVDEKYQEVVTQLEQTEDKLYLKGWELSNKFREKQPLVSFIDDDGKKEVMSVLVPLAEKYNIKWTISLITQFVEAGKNAPAYINVEDVYTLKDLGHEIISHAHTDVRLGTLSKYEQEYQMTRSIQALNSWGIDPQGITYPYRSYNDDTIKLARKYFRYGASGGFGLNGSPLETYLIRTVKIGSHYDGLDNPPYPTDSIEYYKWRVDQAYENKEWLVFVTHIGDTPPEQVKLIEETIQYIKSKGIPIVTMSEALDRVGNVVDTGKFWKSEPYRERFVVGYDGTISSHQVVDYNAGELQDVGLLLPKDFKLGHIYHYRVRANNFNGLPGTPVGGTLTVFALYNSPDYMYQIFHPVNRNYIWKRARRNDNEWREWEQFTPISPEQIVDYNAGELQDVGLLLPKDFALGKIYHYRVRSSNYNGLPGDPISGTLTVFALFDSPDYMYQIFHPNNRNYIWKRARRNDDEWREWERFTPTSESSANENVIVVLPKDTVDINTTLTSGKFERGKITYCEISEGPDGRSGILETNRLGELNSTHYQVFRDGTSIYMRGYTGEEWQLWRKVQVERLDY